jgi:hypothetical protein
VQQSVEVCAILTLVATLLHVIQMVINILLVIQITHSCDLQWKFMVLSKIFMVNLRAKFVLFEFKLMVRLNHLL